ncbi:unnamed protein product [Heligmosomoides polygyrus]|uniref:Uncharacterized protein n=1 Tax=Heligmosomoides polygyrus TaxID=6339 RepID=A0A183FKA5_HELPZ|nr:unnamed protein product [Heligmosomoides polygyrus]
MERVRGRGARIEDSMTTGGVQAENGEPAGTIRQESGGASRRPAGRETESKFVQLAPATSEREVTGVTGRESMRSCRRQEGRATGERSRSSSDSPKPGPTHGRGLARGKPMDMAAKSVRSCSPRGLP